MWGIEGAGRFCASPAVSRIWVVVSGLELWVCYSVYSTAEFSRCPLCDRITNI